MLDTHHRPNLVAAISTCVDHDFTCDIALVGMDRPCAVFVLGQAGDGGMAVDLCTGKSGAPGKRLTQLRGVDMAIGRIPQTTKQIVRRDQRMPARAFGRIYDFELHIHSRSH